MVERDIVFSKVLPPLDAALGRAIRQKHAIIAQKYSDRLEEGDIVLNMIGHYHEQEVGGEWCGRLVAGHCQLMTFTCTMELTSEGRVREQRRGRRSRHQASQSACPLGPEPNLKREGGARLDWAR